MWNDAMDSDSPNNRTRSRIALVAVFAVFFVPVFSAMLIAVVAPHWVPFGSINQGELVLPPIANAMQSKVVLTSETQPSEQPSLWQIVHVSGPRCDPLCQYVLTQMRQARLALGKDAYRVQRWWLIDGQVNSDHVAAIAKEYPGLQVASIPVDSPLLDRAQFPATVQMVDPAGFLMLRYRLDESSKEELARAILKDFKRLLKISKQG
jgi:hypothetical protein